MRDRSPVATAHLEPADAHAVTLRNRRPRLRSAAPWIPFAVVLVCGWRILDVRHQLPAYGDVCEVVYAVRWYAESLAAGTNPLHCPHVFHPDGWSLATLAHGPVLIMALLPLYYLGGAAFAFNVAVLASVAVAYAGMRRLALRFMSAPAAVIAALTFTFWGWRWHAIAGHLHILVASALVPWMLLSLDRGLYDRGELRSFAVAGVLWASAICSSLYMVWIGGILVAAWTLARRPPGIGFLRISALLGLAGAVAILLGMPALFLFWRSLAGGEATLYGVQHSAYWGASANAVPIPFVFHTLSPFERLARFAYRGPLDESAIANLGLVAVTLAVVAAARVERAHPLRRIGWVGVVGVTLALGLFLRWDGKFVRAHGASHIDAALWALGHALKPGAFETARMPRECANAIPLPGLVLAAIVPFWEAARVSSRFILVAAVPTFLLAAATLGRIGSTGPRWVLTILLVLETLPAPVAGVPFPPTPHAAFAWLREHPARGAIVDLHGMQDEKLQLDLAGETILAHDFHGRPSVAGVGSFKPATAQSLDDWLARHPRPLGDDDFAWWLRAYRVRFVLLHFLRGNEQRHLEHLSPGFRLQECFDGPAGPSPWPERICVFQIRPPARRQLAVARARAASSTGDGATGIAAAPASSGLSGALQVARRRRAARVVL